MIFDTTIDGTKAMDLLAELHVVAARLALREERGVCECCGTGRLVLIDERPDPNFAILGLLRQTFKCDSPGCGKLVIV